jgi:hypothetical protein
MKKLASAIPAGVFFGWLYFLGFLYVQAFFNDFSLQGRIASATVDSLLMTGSAALSVGAKPWYLQLPLAGELVLLAGMYSLAAHLMPDRRKADQQDERRELAEEGGEARGESKAKQYGRREGRVGRFLSQRPAWMLALGLLALAVASSMLAYHQGTLSARQVRRRFVQDDRAMRELYFANGRRIRIGPALGCDQYVCAYLSRSGPVLLDRKLLGAEVPLTGAK